MSVPTVGVLAVQGNIAEHLIMVERLGLAAVPVRRPSEVAAVDGLIIPGGESTTMDKLMRRFGLVEPVRALITGGAPVLGTCAGMIMLADTIVDGTHDQQTLGGIDLVVRRNAFGRQVDSFEVELDVGGLDAPYRAVFIRAPWVDRVGPSVEVLAIREVDGADHPVAVRSDALTAVSFHPELTGDPRVHALAFASLLTPTAAEATASRQ